jgi:hypothetical protein
MTRKVRLDPSMLNLAILVFAFLQARSSGYTWIASSVEYGRPIAEYHSESIVFWLALPIIALCSLRGLSLIGLRLQSVAVLALALPALVAEGWLLFFVVGDNAYHISWMTVPPDATL